MNLYLSNTLTHKKELFTPIDHKHVRMYACGPTVYDRPHLGNARAAVVYDCLYRALISLYGKEHVVYVRNVTDVDDKIINACLQLNIPASQLTSEMFEHYIEDLTALNCLIPNHQPKATEYISQMIDIINTLISKGHAYEANGHVLFDVSSYKDYGKLANRSVEEMIAGARVEVAPYKKNPQDFVLWKPSPDSEKAFAFQSPWGLGRPGWHIECSAMSSDLLGEHFDIHGGGADLMFPHHENEIAQSVCSSHCKKFANVWVHNGFLMVEGQKMSKSLGNFFTVQDMLQKGINGMVIRYVYLMTHYKKPIDFTAKTIEDATKALEKLSHALDEKINPEYCKDLHTLFLDDMNTPGMLGLMHEYLKKAEYGKIKYAMELLGIHNKTSTQAIPEEIIVIAELRAKARLDKDWAKSDELRDELLQKGFEVKDLKSGEYELKKVNN